MKNKEKQKNVSIFRMVRLVLPKMCKATPVLFWLQAALSIIHGSSWGLQTIAMQRFFDAATAMAGNAALFLQAVSALLLLCGAYVLTQVLNGVANYLPSVMMNKQQGIFNREVNQKIARLPAIDFENPDRLDDISKAGWGCDSAAWLTFTVLNVFIFYLPYFVVMGWYLFSLKPTLALAILIVFVPTALTQLIRARYFTDLEKESAPVRRQYDYYEQCMTAREYFKETRLLGGFSFFKNLYLNALQTLQKLNFKATMKSNLFELSMRIVTVIGYCLILWMLFIALLNREISIGAFSAVFSSIGILYSIMEEVVCRNFGNIAQNMGKVSNYIRFLELEDAKGTVDTPPGWGDIRLEHVTFRYPLTEKDAVCNVSLTLKKGETLAIVGENGSGKSTLVKLLCGLYLPDSGSVCINGTDTKTLTFRAMFQNISAVFQRYEPFKLTLRENITISESDKEIKEPELESVCAAAGVEVDGPSYPQRFDTMLSREFDGVDLSGGQWQRVAIARGFYRTHNVIVLDEPTAAIDPFEETKIYNRFAQISKNKSAVIVTHRLGSVKLADRIAVMKDGALVQVGTHAELIAKDGEYKRLYQAQEKWYQKKVKV